jgi:hypothetical protein
MAESTTATQARSTISSARPASRLQARAQFTTVMTAGRLAHWFVPGKKAQVNRQVVLETWDAVSDGTHNSNTDLTFWNGHFYLCHQTSPYHLGSSRSRMLLWRSKDARSWEQVTVFKADSGEYRDPTFGQINGKLYLYLLPNKERNPEPFTTAWSSSADGRNWTPLVEVDHPGWLYWRPKTIDGKTWYVTAYWHEHGKSALLKSPNGERWEMVSQIFQGERNDETDFEFMADGRILSTARLEGKGGWEGDPASGTLIATSAPPYEQWSYARSHTTRFDGPCLFPYNGRIYGVGRYQSSFFPRVAEQGGLFSRKRTSLFQLDERGLTRLTDLPSAGDTSYAGIAMRGNELYVSYYTSDVKEDPAWVVGMFQPSAIKMARVSLPAMERLAEKKRSKTTAAPV